MSDPVRGAVVAHSDVARALVEAVRIIAGLEPGALVAVSNEGLGPDAIRDRLAEALPDGDPAIIFSDLREGSCGIAAQRLCLGRPGHVVVTGVNLPMLLDFAMKRHLPMEDLVQRVVDRGRNAIQAIPGSA
ncbi:MAG: PTS sugar transporter subunit IIA [Gemmatimonadota bacterium]